MILREAIGYIVGFETKLIDKVLIDKGLDGSVEYNQSMAYTSKLIAAYVLRELAHMPEFQEGQYRVQWDRKQLIRRANELFRKLGLDSEIQTNIRVQTL